MPDYALIEIHPKPGDPLFTYTSTFKTIRFASIIQFFFNEISLEYGSFTYSTHVFARTVIPLVYHTVYKSAGVRITDVLETRFSVSRTFFSSFTNISETRLHNDDDLTLGF